MDAKPQRPPKAFKAFADENAQVLPKSKGALHQRGKSTGAIATMFVAGGLKVAAKRSALHDVSNASKDVALGERVSFIGKKPTLEQMIRKETDTLIVPAQRAKGVLSIEAMAQTAKQSSAVQPVADIATGMSNVSIAKAESQALNNRVIKKAAVYQDGKAGAEAASKIQVTAPTKAQDKLIEHSTKTVASSQQKAGSQTGEKILKLIGGGKFANADPKLSVPAIKTTETQETKRSLAVKAKPAESRQKRAAAKKAAVIASVTFEQRARQVSGTPEDSDTDDEGVVTTFLSDDTSGCVTQIIFPKITQNVRRELIIAKEITEGERTEVQIENDYMDISMAYEYAEDIFDYMKEMELKLAPNPHYMDIQTEIQWSMRSVLMDWMIQVHHRFRMLPETLFLAVNILDRFLSVKIVSLIKLQLAGCTALWIAGKYEEINAPQIQEMLYMVDNGYTQEEILKAERFMLTLLDFELGFPGPMSFLRRSSKADNYDTITRTLAKYFMEMTLTDERFVATPPSYLAAAAHCLSRFMLGKGTWTAAHVHWSGYTYSQLRPLICMLLDCCVDPIKHHEAIFEKHQMFTGFQPSLYVNTQIHHGFTLPHVQPIRRPRPVLKASPTPPSSLDVTPLSSPGFEQAADVSDLVKDFERDAQEEMGGVVITN